MYYDSAARVVDFGSVPAEPANGFHPETMLFRDDALTLPLVNYLGTDSEIDPYNPVNHAIAKGFVRNLFSRGWGLGGPTLEQKLDQNRGCAP
jgi:hypothetical protein